MSALYTVPFVIGDKEEAPTETTHDLHDVVSPATGLPLHRYASATDADADAAVAAASAALPGWRATTPAARRDLLLAAAAVMRRRRAELAAIMTAEVDGGQGWAEFNLDNGEDLLRDVAGRVAGAVAGGVPGLADPASRAMVLKEPYGVVLAMAPWNAPYILATRAVLFPIAAGCTVVLKGSERSPRAMHAVVSVLREAGLPDGVLNLVFASPDGGRAAEVTGRLVAHPRVSKVNFTGSTAVGRAIGAVAGENLKPAVMELGGKGPAIVWEDADLELAAQQCALGAFLFAGQVCMSTEKIIVHRAVAAPFLERLAAATDRLFPRAGEAPVLVAAEGVAKVQRLVRDATDKGARVVYGDAAEATGAKAAEKEEGEGTTTTTTTTTPTTPTTRMRPVVLAGVTADMDIYWQESFGPSVSVLEASTEEEALRLANDSEFGLNAAVFTEDLRRGLRLAAGIESGAVHINNMTVHDESALPHGGAKASGYGRFNTALGLDEWLRAKTVTWKA